MFFNNVSCEMHGFDNLNVYPRFPKTTKIHHELLQGLKNLRSWYEDFKWHRQDASNAANQAQLRAQTRVETSPESVLRRLKTLQMARTSVWSRLKSGMCCCKREKPERSVMQTETSVWISCYTVRLYASDICRPDSPLALCTVIIRSCCVNITTH